MGCRPACKQLSFVHRYDYVPHDKPSMFCNDEQKETEIETCEPYSSSLFPLRVRFFPVDLSNLAHARSKVFQQYAAGGAPRSGSFKSGARSFKSLLKVRRWCGTAEPVFQIWHTFVQKSSKRMPPARQREAGILKPHHDCTNVLLKHCLRQFFSPDAIWASNLAIMSSPFVSRSAYEDGEAFDHYVSTAAKPSKRDASAMSSSQQETISP